jgi:hypothetical protein
MSQTTRLLLQHMDEASLFSIRSREIRGGLYVHKNPEARLDLPLDYCRIFGQTDQRRTDRASAVVFRRAIPRNCG